MKKEKRKLFFDRVKTFFYRNKMILIIGFSIILLVSLLLLGSTYGYYEENLELQNSVEMTVATLSYGINEEYKVVVPAGEEVKVPIAVMGLNSVATKYQMYYRSSDDLTKVIVGYASYSEYLPSGDLEIKESKRIDLILQNSGEDPVTIFIGVKGGYQNNRVEDIILGNGEIRITNRIESEEVEEDMATPEDILDGKKAWVNGSKITGIMVDRGAINQTLKAGGSYTIPKGYHNGSGKITAASLASQTQATATASQILSGQTAWVNGKKITGTMANRGTINQTLKAGESYTISQGYHNGSGKITAASLSSQTPGTASAEDIASGKTAWVNGEQVVGTATMDSDMTYSRVKLNYGFTSSSTITIPAGYTKAYLTISYRAGGGDPSISSEDTVTYKGVSSSKKLYSYIGAFSQTYHAAYELQLDGTQGSITVTPHIISGNVIVSGEIFVTFD